MNRALLRKYSRKDTPYPDSGCSDGTSTAVRPQREEKSRELISGNLHTDTFFTGQMRLRAWFSEEKQSWTHSGAGTNFIADSKPHPLACQIVLWIPPRITLQDTCRTVKQGGQLIPEKVNIRYGQEDHYKGRALLVQWFPASKDGPTPFPCKVNKGSSWKKHQLYAQTAESTGQSISSAPQLAPGRRQEGTAESREREGPFSEHQTM